MNVSAYLILGANLLLVRGLNMIAIINPGVELKRGYICYPTDTKSDVLILAHQPTEQFASGTSADKK